MTGLRITRRNLMAMGVAAPALGAVIHSPAKAAIDLSDPEEGHRANVKLRGSLGNEWVWRHYWGETHATLPGEPPIPLFKFEGVIKTQWTDNGDGTHTELLYDMSGNTDWNSGELLTQFNNPITGKTNDVMHTWDGPNRTTYSKFGPIYPWTAEKPNKPVVLPWKIVDDSVWLSEEGNFERPHPLDPEEWPLASSGKTTISMINVTLSGLLADIEDEERMSVPHNMTWTAMRSWLPWLLLGQRPGLMLTIGKGRKISGPDAIPASMRAIIDALQPNFISDEAPWTEATNSWTRYKTERQPIR